MVQERPREFQIIIDHKPYKWPDPFITGSQIKHLAGVDPSYGVWMDLPGPEDPPIEDGQPVDLRAPGVERFFTGKRTTTEGAADEFSTTFGPRVS